MLLHSDADLASLLRRTKTIAVLGASLKPERPSYQVCCFLMAQGFQVIPVNPGLAGQQLAGHEIVGLLSDIAQTVDLVDVFRHSDSLLQVVDEAHAHGAKAIWTQLNVVHRQAIESALAHGIEVVVDKCPAIEIPRLRSLGIEV